MSFEEFHTAGDPDVDEHQLWHSFLNDNLDAWEHLFKLYYRDLYGYGLKLSHRPELVRDCIHELFVILWDRRKHLEEVHSVKAYLLASLRRSILKDLKRERKHPVYRPGNQLSDSHIQFPAEEFMIRDERKAHTNKALYNALECLPDRQKEVLFLKYFNGMSYDEIEEILSINYQTIRNHIYRAIKRLRNILGDHITEIVISLLLFMLSAIAA